MGSEGSLGLNPRPTYPTLPTHPTLLNHPTLLTFPTLPTLRNANKWQTAPHSLKILQNNTLMKRLLSLSITFLFTFTVFFVQIHQAFGQDGPAAVDGSPVTTTTSQTVPLSEVCKQVEADNKEMTFDPNDSGGNENEIVVLLTERIGDSGGMTYSCSQAIECLRIMARREMSQKAADNPTSTSAEVFVMKSLEKNFKPCIVSGKDGLDLLNEYATRVYQWIAGIVGSICILIIIVSGIQISIGGLSQEEVSAAKDRISRSLIGMVVLFLSAFILYSINPIFFT